ncbi:hypothetical protein GS399_09855 [Pedobacter sp. HMF7647]|uniref:Methylated-DNA-[protein]-cysteine S-methyltransferase DNA binding domain-containing protein n=1 Tax=Hufsiella arboris TaxID=2695275 RepID=A0A7K1Y9M3_9SPHI|nr:MGMT family protein [Hufsiella arboris]MXV51272.1 hypothetical protein [Hufsiella arboris]
MSNISFLEKLQTAPQATFHKLDVVKSKRMAGAQTLYIPSVSDVAETIRKIPKGETKTIEQLRDDLAKIGKADTACPAKTIKYWKWMASLNESPVKYPEYDIPWWRVLKSGKPSRHMPGGIENQLKILKAEGVDIKL